MEKICEMWYIFGATFLGNEFGEIYRTVYTIV